MRARIGDLTIIKFDSDDAGTRYEERVGIVTGCFITLDGREYEFIYWDKISNRIEVIRSSLPTGTRLVRARPKKKWNGELSSLTINDVVPV